MGLVKPHPWAYYCDMMKAPETLQDVMSLIERLHYLNSDDPREAIALASAHLPAAEKIGSCAQARLLAVRGAGWREINDLDRAGVDIAMAEKICTCKKCRPRTARQWALLLTCQGAHDEARKTIAAALWLCAETGQLDYIPRILSSRSVVLFYAGDITGAIEASRGAIANVGPKDGLLYLLVIQRFSVFLMASASRSNWLEAWEMLNENNIRAVNGSEARRLKWSLRWAQALVAVELGYLPLDKARIRISRIIAELDGRHLPIHTEYAEEERKHAKRTKERALYQVAGLVSDAALLGGAHSIVTRGAKQALGILADVGGTDDLRQALIDLCGASEQGADVWSPALRLRELCPGAPPLPPSLTSDKTA